MFWCNHTTCFNLIFARQYIRQIERKGYINRSLCWSRQTIMIILTLSAQSRSHSLYPARLHHGWFQSMNLITINVFGVASRPTLSILLNLHGERWRRVWTNEERLIRLWHWSNLYYWIPMTGHGFMTGLISTNSLKCPHDDDIMRRTLHNHGGLPSIILN